MWHFTGSNNYAATDFIILFLFFFFYQPVLLHRGIKIVHLLLGQQPHKLYNLHWCVHLTLLVAFDIYGQSIIRCTVSFSFLGVKVPSSSGQIHTANLSVCFNPGNTGRKRSWSEKVKRRYVCYVCCTLEPLVTGKVRII